MDILYLVDRLENLIASSRRMPLFNQIMVKEADMLDIIETMRTAIPDEIKQARRIIQEKERILAQAQAEASSLLAKAREESEKAMKRDGLLRAAEERSETMLRQAEEKAERLKIEADAYVVETLRALHEHLSGVEMEIDRSLISIEKGLESMEEHGEIEMGDNDEEEHDPPYLDDGTNATQDRQDSPGAKRVQQADTTPRPGQQPRRALLAVDTMGGPMLPPS
ncbi:MAG TPA: hypothetical protein VGT44_14540 [Ktedonobacteraceae bacterium]|nr:hypothetical protein [Ktedonobacteraceae bacterium]